jgi:hypothetical protein
MDPFVLHARKGMGEVRRGDWSVERVGIEERKNIMSLTGISKLKTNGLISSPSCTPIKYPLALPPPLLPVNPSFSFFRLRS